MIQRPIRRATWTKWTEDAGWKGSSSGMLVLRETPLLDPACISEQNGFTWNIDVEV